MTRLRIVMALAALCWAPGQAAAQAPAEHLFIAAGDSVYDITGGAATVLVDGLEGAQDVCVGPGGELYVSEELSGEITMVSEGTTTMFASGLTAPVGLWCDDEQILVSDRSTGTIVDASDGGDLSATPPFASALGEPTALLTDRAGNLWVADSRASGSQVFDVTSDGAEPHASYAGVVGGLAEHDGMLLASLMDTAKVVVFGPGGDLASAESIATIDQPGAMLSLHNTMLLVSSSNGSVVDVLDGNTYVDGIDGIDHGGMTYVHHCGDAIVAPDEACDDGVATIKCRDTCTEIICGDGIVDASSETCDDGNTDDGDSCSAHCQLSYSVPPKPGFERDGGGACGCHVVGPPQHGARLAAWLGALLLLGQRFRRSARGSQRRCR